MRVTGSGVVHVFNIYLIPPTELENETEAGRHKKLIKTLSPRILITFLTHKSIIGLPKEVGEGRTGVGGGGGGLIFILLENQIVESWVP